MHVGLKMVSDCRNLCRRCPALVISTFLSCVIPPPSFLSLLLGKDVVSGLDSLISSEPASYWPAPSSFLFVIGGDVMYIYPATDVWLNGGGGRGGRGRGGGGGSYSISCCHGY